MFDKLASEPYKQILVAYKMNLYARFIEMLSL